MAVRECLQRLEAFAQSQRMAPQAAQVPVS